MLTRVGGDDEGGEEGVSVRDPPLLQANKSKDTVSKKRVFRIKVPPHS